MFNKIKEINTLIDKKIELLEKDKDQTRESNLELVRLYNDLEKDINKLIYIDKDELKELINRFDIEDNNRLYKEILTIKKILTMNKDYKSTLRLFKKDKDSYQYFLNSFKKFNEFCKNNDPNIVKITAKQNEFLKLKENLGLDSYKLKVKDLKLIEEIFSENEDKAEILVELIDYENERFKGRLAKSKKKKKVDLDEKDIFEVMNKYGYNFNEMEDIYKKYLLDYGKLKNIEEVLATLEENKYPIIKDNFVLTSILLGSSPSTIKQVSAFAKENKLIPPALLDISGALITQNDNTTSDMYSIMTKGSSIDFMRNIVTLKNAGISINYIYQACKSILTMPNKLLIKNLDLFNKYGFSFEYKKRGAIDPSPCALLSQNFAEICDAFIEIHPNGLKYLIDNLSNLKTVSNPDALMFYNIYYSQKHFKGNIDDPDDGPFRIVMEEDNENYQLKAIITRNRPDYRGTYYQDIREDNKKEKTNTLKIDIPDMETYEKLINNNKDTNISNSIFNNPYIQAINKYIDNDSALIYNFKGIRISRLKVLRIYNILVKNNIKDSIDSFMYAITYNSIISPDDYMKIEKCIKKEVENR